MDFTRKVVTRKSPFTERGNEIAITILILFFGVIIASIPSLPVYFRAAAVVGLTGVCVIYNLCLEIRNHRRSIPVILDTVGRWHFAETENGSELPPVCYCEIPRSEHKKGPNPKILLANEDLKPVDLGIVLRSNENGDIRLALSTEKLMQIGRDFHVKLSIVGR